MLGTCVMLLNFWRRNDSYTKSRTQTTTLPPAQGHDSVEYVASDMKAYALVAYQAGRDESLEHILKLQDLMSDLNEFCARKDKSIKRVGVAY